MADEGRGGPLWTSVLPIVSCEHLAETHGEGLASENSFCV